METIVSKLLIILLMNGSVLIIPGVNFLLIIRHSVSFGRIAAIQCALGITTAILMYAVLACYSVGLILTKFPVVFYMIKYLGVTFLIFLAWSALRMSNNSNEIIKKKRVIRKNGSFIEGLLVDLFNPFVSIFYISLFSTIIQPDTTVVELWVYILAIFSLTIGWFLFVAIISSARKLRDVLLAKNSWFYRFASIAFIYYAYRLAVTQIN